MATLFTFGASHYCEKARWALDIAAVDYQEVCWAPGPHLLSARRLAARSQVPILRHPQATIQGSGQIMDWIGAGGRTGWNTAASAAEDAEIGRVEARADKGLGVAVRRLIYAMSLGRDHRKIARQLFRGVIWWQQPLARLMWPISRQAIMKGLQASPADIPAARAALEQEMSYLDAMLSGQRRFIVGSRFSRADLTVASLLSPIALPPEHPFYRDMPLWNAQREIAETYRDRPCVRWAAALYRNFRQPARGDAVPHSG